MSIGCRDFPLFDFELRCGWRVRGSLAEHSTMHRCSADRFYARRADCESESTRRANEEMKEKISRMKTDPLRSQRAVERLLQAERRRNKYSAAECVLRLCVKRKTGKKRQLTKGKKRIKTLAFVMCFPLSLSLAAKQSNARSFFPLHYFFVHIRIHLLTSIASRFAQSEHTKCVFCQLFVALALRCIFIYSLSSPLAMQMLHFRHRSTLQTNNEELSFMFCIIPSLVFVFIPNIVLIN